MPYMHNIYTSDIAIARNATHITLEHHLLPTLALPYSIEWRDDGPHCTLNGDAHERLHAWIDAHGVQGFSPEFTDAITGAAEALALEQQTEFLSLFDDDSLAKAVIAQCGGWGEFPDMAESVASHGADGGYSGWIYFDDTCEFFRANREAIRTLVERSAEGLGEEPLAMVANFNCLRDCTTWEVANAFADRGEECDSIQNALAWFALEEVSRAYVYSL